jgi:hypothetical protein
LGAWPIEHGFALTCEGSATWSTDLSILRQPSARGIETRGIDTGGIEIGIALIGCSSGEGIELMFDRTYV